MKNFFKKHFSQIIFWLLLITALSIRIVNLSQNPPSLYWEEIALGYDAYSIAQTGADHHGNPYPLLAFESFGDWKPNLYFYAIVPFVKILGLTPLAIRLPSALAGTLTVLGLYFLVKKLTNKKTLALWAMFFITFNPWAIQFSRGGWEANFALCLIIWGVIALISSLKHLKNQPNLKPQLSSHQIKDLSAKTSTKKLSFQFNLDWSFIIGLILLILSMYAYHSARVVAPLLGLFLFAVWLIKQKFNWQKIWQTLTLSFVLAFILLIPFLQNLNSPQLNNRFSAASIFNDPTPILQSNVCLEAAGPTKIMARLTCHRFIFQALYFAENYSLHLNPSFLFLQGETNPRHTTGYFGLFFPFDFILLAAGLGYFIFSHQVRVWQKGFIFFWLFISIIPSALSSIPGAMSLEAPHALRILLGLPAWIILLAFGANSFWRTGRHYFNKTAAQIIQILVIILTLGQFTLWSYHYYHVYPLNSGPAWQEIYPRLFSTLDSQITKNNHLPLNIYFSRQEGRPAMAYWFYHQTDPRLVQEQNATAPKDLGEYLQFTNRDQTYHFIEKQIEITNPQEGDLVVLPIDEINKLQSRFPRFQIVETINNGKGQPAWQIARYV